MVRTHFILLYNWALLSAEVCGKADYYSLWKGRQIHSCNLPEACVWQGGNRSCSSSSGWVQRQPLFLLLNRNVFLLLSVAQEMLRGQGLSLPQSFFLSDHYNSLPFTFPNKPFQRRMRAC